MRKTVSLYAVPYVLILLAIFAALNPVWLRPLPPTKVYAGRLGFSEKEANQNLRAMVLRYTDRYPGARVNRNSALWMADRFRQMGIETKLDRFDTLAPENIWSPGFLFQPFNQTHQQVQGVNVLAFSRGRSPSVVLFLAHRDVLPGVARSSGDNAGGNALLLELARVLSPGDHFYSYMFVSLDVEESGRQGARFLAQFHPELSLRLAIFLDNVTTMGARSLAPFHPGSARQAPPLWTQALAQQVMVAEGLDPYDGGERGADLPPGVWSLGHAVQLLASLAEQRGFGVHPSSGARVFLDRGDPVIAVEAGTHGRGNLLWFDAAAPPAADPEPREILKAMSVESLVMAGRFSERYVRSLELNQFDSEALTRSYVTWQGLYLPPNNLAAFMALTGLAFVMLVVLPFRYPPVSWRNFGNFIERDRPWLGRIAGLALISGAIWMLPRLPFLRFLPPVVYLALTAIIALVGGLSIVRKRQYFLRLWHFDPTMANQRRMLALALVFLFLLYSLILNPISAAGMLFLPLLVWSAARFQQARSRTFWLAGFAVWTVLHLALGGLVLFAALSYTPPWSLRGLLAFSLNSALWLGVLVYVFSTPPLGVIERR